MIVRFGNLTIPKFIEKVGVELEPSDVEFLESHRQNNATVTAPDKLHIYDMPLGIVAGSDIAQDLIDRLSGYEYNKSFYIEAIEAL